MGINISFEVNQRFLTKRIIGVANILINNLKMSYRHPNNALLESSVLPIVRCKCIYFVYCHFTTNKKYY